MLDPKKVRLGMCPIGWSNDDMWDLGDENTFQQCVSEMALAGFTGSEVGHKYPEDKAVLKHMLDVRGMTIASKWFSSFLVDKPYEEVEADFIKELEYLSYVGATAINISEQSGSIQGKQDVAILDMENKRVLTDESRARDLRYPAAGTVESVCRIPAERMRRIRIPERFGKIRQHIAQNFERNGSRRRIVEIYSSHCTHLFLRKAPVRRAERAPVIPVSRDRDKAGICRKVPQRLRRLLRERLPFSLSLC